MADIPAEAGWILTRLELLSINFTLITSGYLDNKLICYI